MSGYVSMFETVRIMKSKLLYLLPLLAMTDLNAQEADFELVIEGVHVRNSETALPVTIITGGELISKVKATVGDTLATQPGINNASFGPAVGQPVIRGQQGRRVMNLSNGMINADAAGNSADHANTIEPMLADSIEVMRGPSTLLYGGGAIGGVVNIVDSRIAESLLPASAEFEFRHNTASDMDTFVGELEFPVGPVAIHLDLTNRDWNDLEVPGLAIDPRWMDDPDEENFNGFIANTGGRSTSATVGLSYIFNNGYIGFAINEMETFYGLPAGIHAHEHEEVPAEAEEADFTSIDLERTRYDLRGEWNDFNSFIENISYRMSLTNYQHVELEGDGAIGTRFSNDSVSQRLQLSHYEINNWHGILGLQINSELFGAVGEESFIPETDTDSFGLYLVEALHINPFTFEFGARINRDEFSTKNNVAPRKSFSTFSYSGSVLYDLNAYFTIGLATSHSERSPWTEELYSNFSLTNINDCVVHFASAACEIGNTALQEEKANNSDLSVYFDYGDLDSTLTFFYNRFSDYIFLETTGAEINEIPVRRYQQEDAKFYGLEIDLNYLINNEWATRLFADSIIGKLDTVGDVPRMPPYRIGSEINYDNGNLSSSLSMLHAFSQNNPGANEFPTGSYTRLDAELNYTINNVSNGELILFSKLRNITDEEIRLSTSFLRGFAPESGRSLELGARYRF